MDPLFVLPIETTALGRPDRPHGLHQWDEQLRQSSFSTMKGPRLSLDGRSK